jgi:protein-tyrosine phosphatase
MKSILFVCLGNICRSPIAHGIAQYYVTKNNLDIKIDSCGTSSWHIWESPCSNSFTTSYSYIIKMRIIDLI